MEWIDCKEQLPERGQIVLGFCKVGIVKRTEYIRICNYFSVFTNRESGAQLRTVTHWMPLPLPPNK